MDSLKYFALMAGVSLALTCPVATYAADAAAEPGHGMEAGNDRSISIGQLKAPQPAAIRPVATPIQHHAAVQPTRKHVSKIQHRPATAKTPVKINQPVATKSQPVKPIQTTPTVEDVAPVQNVAHTNVRPEGAVISAWLDRQGTTPKYKVGDRMVVNVTASTDCNLVVFNYDAKGTLTQLYPNSFQPSGFVKQGDSIQIGGPDSPFDYEVTGKGGLERIFVYAYPTGTEQPITVAMNTIPNSPFRSIEMPTEKYLAMVNESKVFFSREIKVVPKKTGAASSTPATQTISSSKTEAVSAQPNKVELTFMVDGN